MKVQSPSDGQQIVCGTIYPAAPDRHLLIEHNCLRLGRGARENNFRPAADPLFRTAAASFGPDVIGVVLSGNLDDGSSGLLAIKRAGGIAIVQDPADAAYAGMPASALQEVPSLDHVLPVGRIGELLLELVGVSGDGRPLLRGGRAIPHDIAMGGERPVTQEERTEDKPQSGFGCPACGGALWEGRDGDMVRYRCRVGHMFSDEALLSAQTESLETALWTALRALEEAAEQAVTLASRMRTRGHPALAQRFDRQSEDALRRAGIVRQALNLNQEDAKNA